VKEAPTVPTTETPLKPAEFVASGLSITPLTMKPSDTATVSVTITNTGEVQGTYKVTLKLNGITETSQDVTIAGGASEKLAFIVTRSTPGSYDISIDGLSAKLIVEAPVTTTTASVSNLKRAPTGH